MNLYGSDFSRDGLLKRVGRLDQVAGVRLVTLGDGNERGVRVLEFRTGSGFVFEVLVDRAFDIGRCEFQGMPLGWESPVGYGGPWFGEYVDLGFLRNWGGGLLTTCGLDHALFMAEDTAAHYHYPPKQTESFGLHGRVSNRPARLNGYGTRWEGDEAILWAEGEVTQASVFGENLLLRRRIEARIGDASLKVHDEVINAGWDPTPHMLLYHINIGFPVVDEGSELIVPTRAAIPRGDFDSAGYRTLTAPQPAFVEEVVEHDIIAEADGKVPVGIVNRKRGIGAYEIFDVRQLPAHFVWRMMGEGTYVVGIEPCTNRPAGRLDARERGELIILQPGESRRYDLELGALITMDEIDGLEQRVQRLGGI
ncbi:MAG TPA: aldose 1-epimerase family protein [Thermomicrobiales bacterium]|nr:aldose 1-epimerase family protein [Thermomicrobiales bacterium]